MADKISIQVTEDEYRICVNDSEYSDPVEYGELADLTTNDGRHFIALADVASNGDLETLLGDEWVMELKGSGVTGAEVEELDAFDGDEDEEDDADAADDEDEDDPDEVVIEEEEEPQDSTKV